MTRPNFDSIFITRKHEAKGSLNNISVYYKQTNEIIATVKYIPDALYPRYEILDKKGHTVGVALTSSDTQVHLTNLINSWLEEEGLKQQKSFVKETKDNGS